MNRTRKAINILDQVDKKYREFLEVSEIKFYLEDEKYFIKMDMHYDELGSFEDVIYFLDCQLLEQ